MINSKIKIFYHRSLSVALLAPVFIWMLFYNRWTYFCMFLIIKLLALGEYCRILKISKPNKLLCLTLSFFIYSFIFLDKISLLDQRTYIIAYAMLLCIVFGVMMKKGDPKLEMINEVGLVFLGVIYIALPMGLMHHVVIEGATYDYRTLMAIFMCIWATDTGAYVLGSTMGKTKCFKEISPNKSLEGVIGGLLGSLIAAYFAKNSFFRESWSAYWYFLGFIIAFGSIVGDLFESFLKRACGVKDSGKLIPGHGGILDRFDSFLFVIGLIWIFKMLVY